MTIALVQMSSLGGRAENLDKAVGLLERAVERGAGLVCFQELFLGRYFCQVEDAGNFALAEDFPGELGRVMSGHAKRLGVVLVAPFFERRAPGVFHNSAMVVDADGEILGQYRKMHIPHDPGYAEKYYFTPGDLGFRVWDTAVGRIGVMICWDQWFPEAARVMALRGAGILFYPTAIGWHPGERAERGGEQLESWRLIQRAHAVANGCYVAAVNRVGFEKMDGAGDGIQFWGHSFVADPAGAIVVEAGEAGDEVLLAEIDPARVDRQRIEWPFFRDRRVDAYGELKERFTGE